LQLLFPLAILINGKPRHHANLFLVNQTVHLFQQRKITYLNFSMQGKKTRLKYYSAAYLFSLFYIISPIYYHTLFHFIQAEFVKGQTGKRYSPMFIRVAAFVYFLYDFAPLTFSK
ncbi:MAG: hypothetical protein K2G89_01510, partial [Lachnospiraceae bacterium]|nr:hypothetical protein [Lachnospiraceae bacterium]